jgi:uncharacterized protein (DUF924 family)
MNEESILFFWFNELEANQWWAKDDSLDLKIKNRYAELHQKAIKGELFQWRTTPRGRLAEIIVLDQFSRNIYRDSPRAFAYDSMALALAQEAVALKVDLKLCERERPFLYMPYMHSESHVIHDEAVKLFEGLANSYNLEFEHKHREIIVKFGRYPHRNKVLNRRSTSEEIAFLKTPGSSF